MSEETHKKEHKEHDEKHLEKLTIKELREIAEDIPHERAIHDMKKEELVAFIKEARGIKDEAPVKKKKHIGKIKMTKPELKAKIRELKTLRWQALESKENEKSSRLRHQISQLKKKSRRLAAV
jgi:ribosomal protein L11